MAGWSAATSTLQRDDATSTPTCTNRSTPAAVDISRPASMEVNPSWSVMSRWVWLSNTGAGNGSGAGGNPPVRLFTTCSPVDRTFSDMTVTERTDGALEVQFDGSVYPAEDVGHGAEFELYSDPGVRDRRPGRPAAAGRRVPARLHARRHRGHALHLPARATGLDPHAWTAVAAPAVRADQSRAFSGTGGADQIRRALSRRTLRGDRRSAGRVPGGRQDPR